MTNEMVISPFHHSYSANLCAPYLCYCGVQTTPWIINPPEETLLKHFVSGVMVRVRWWIFREDSYSGGGIAA